MCMHSNAKHWNEKKMANECLIEHKKQEVEQQTEHIKRELTAA